MDTETCELRLIEAARTLQCLPDPDLKFRSSYKCPLPEHTLDYGGTRDRYTPSPKEISRYEETLGWLKIIPVVREQKFMYWAFASQRGEKKFRIQWPMPKKRSGVGGSNYHCRILYRSWIQAMSKNI